MLVITLYSHMYENRKLSKDNGQFLYCLGLLKEDKWLSYIGRRADALALRADERRDKLRKAAVSCK